MTKPGFDYEEQIPPGYYDKIYQRKAGVRYCWHDLKFRSVAAHLTGAGRLLDVGCGPGTFIGNYLGDGEALGVDLSQAQIDYANRHYSTGSHRFSAQSIASLVEAGERFDTITMIELLEHLPPDDATALLVQARSLLSTNGTLIMTTPNYRSLWPIIEWGVNLLSPVSYEQQHINKYNRARLARHLTDAGYRTVTVRTVVGLAPFAAVLGPRPVQWLHDLESGVGNLGCGNLLLALAKA
jgi:2-polyprenyl-3-methyl-5-hydroxy-6-metoxy-1,4-benzoquinol methylase